MAEACSCTSGIVNLGTACSPGIAPIQKLIFLEYFDSDGEVIEADISGTLNKAYFDAYTNHATKKLRWYPTPSLKSVTNERGENLVEGYPDQSTGFVGEGVKSFIGYVVGKEATPKLAHKMNSGRCANLSAYGVDKTGNWIGKEITKGMIAPIRIDSDSFNARYIEATDTTQAKIEIKFNWHVDEQDGDLIMVASDELDWDISQIRGLLDITGTYSSISQTGCTLTLETEYGTPLNPVMDEGLVAADFTSAVTAATSKFRNVTDSADIAITSVTETAPGVYVFVFTSQTVSDVMKTLPVKLGRDYTLVAATTFTIV